MKRFAESGLEGLKNLPRAGRPSEVSEEGFAEIKRELSDKSKIYLCYMSK
ncbi:MAG: hypothetical protein WA667_00545 [Candidatus Nitrosopolaris sp.]